MYWQLVTICTPRKIQTVTPSHQDRDVEKSAAGRERLNLLLWQWLAGEKYRQASQGYLSHRIATKNPSVPVPKSKGVRVFSRPAISQQQLTDNNKDVTWLLAIGPVLQRRTWPTYDQEKYRVQCYQIRLFLTFLKNCFNFGDFRNSLMWYLFNRFETFLEFYCVFFNAKTAAILITL